MEIELLSQHKLQSTDTRVKLRSLLQYMMRKNIMNKDIKEISL